jgi:hypothetical protein
MSCFHELYTKWKRERNIEDGGELDGDGGLFIHGLNSIDVFNFVYIFPDTWYNNEGHGQEGPSRGPKSRMTMDDESSSNSFDSTLEGIEDDRNRRNRDPPKRNDQGLPSKKERQIIILKRFKSMLTPESKYVYHPYTAK